MPPSMNDHVRRGTLINPYLYTACRPSYGLIFSVQRV